MLLLGRVENHSYDLCSYALQAYAFTRLAYSPLAGDNRLEQLQTVLEAVVLPLH